MLAAFPARSSERILVTNQIFRKSAIKSECGPSGTRLQNPQQFLLQQLSNNFFCNNSATISFATTQQQFLSQQLSNNFFRNNSATISFATTQRPQVVDRGLVCGQDDLNEIVLFNNLHTETTIHCMNLHKSSKIPSASLGLLHSSAQSKENYKREMNWRGVSAQGSVIVNKKSRE